MVSNKGASNRVSKRRGRNHNKSKVNTKTSVPKEQKMNRVDEISYLTNDTKVKISVSPKEAWKKFLEDSSIPENFITNTTRVEKTAPCAAEIEKHLETSNYIEKMIAHLHRVSRNSPGSEGTLSSSDNSHRPGRDFTRKHLPNSKNAVGIPIPLKRKREQTSCIKPQMYDYALDMSQHHSQSRKEEEISNNMESSDTSFIKIKPPEHKLKKKKYQVIKEDLFDVTSPVVLHQTKQLVKHTQSKSGNLNADSEITKSYDQPKTFESRSSTDSILNMKPKNVLRKNVPRAHRKNPFASLVATSNNIDPIAETENKTGYVSAGSGSSIASAAVNVRNNFKHIRLKSGMFDSVFENPVVEDSVPNMQPNENVPCTSEQQSKDISAEMEVLKAPVPSKIVGKLNKKSVQHNVFESVVGNDDEQNVEKQHSDIALVKNCVQNTLTANISADMDVVKAPAYPKNFGEINKHLQPNFFESVVANADENVEQNIEEQNNGIAIAENYAPNTLTANSKESMDILATDLFVRKVFMKKYGSVLTQTLRNSETQGHSHDNQSLERRRQTNDGGSNCSIDKLVERKFLRSYAGTSEYNCSILPEFGKLTESPSDSLTVSKFRPKSTSSKIYLAKDKIAGQCPPTLVALQLKVASDKMSLTHNEKQTDQSGNIIVSQPKSTDHESGETDYKKRNKCYDSVCDNSLPSSDLTFDPDNVPHSTMVQSSSKKKQPPPDMHIMEPKSRRSLLNSFLELAQVSSDSDEKISLGTESACIRNEEFILNDRETENQAAIENDRNDSGMKYSGHHSNIVEKDANFANKISVPENLDVVSDHEPVAENIPTNVLDVLRSNSRLSSKLSASNNDVSKVFRRVSYKTKNPVKSSYSNSQEELVSTDGKNEKKQQGNDTSVPGKFNSSPKNIVCNGKFNSSPENIVCNELSMGCDTKCSKSLPCIRNVSSHSCSKTHENTFKHMESEQISPFDASAQKMCSSEVEELKLRKSDKISFRTERRKSSYYSYNANLSSKLSETDALNSKKGSNLTSSSKKTGTSIENKSDYAGAPDCDVHSTLEETPEQRKLSSPFLTASHISKMSHKENSSNARLKESNKSSTVSNVSNAKIVHSISPGFSNENNDKKHDDYMKGSLHGNRQTENEREIYTDTQPHLTVDNVAIGAQGEGSLIMGEKRELSHPFLSASRVNKSSIKENSINTENNSKIRSKESNKNSMVKNLSDSKITHLVSSDTSNKNNKRLYDYLNDNSHREGQTKNEGQSYPDTQLQPIGDGDENATEGERPVTIREPLKESKHQKELDVKQTRPKPTAHTRFLIDGKPYHKPKLLKPKPWINQRFYNHVLPTFDKKYRLKGAVKCEDFVKLLCDEVEACIRERKNWDVHVYNVQDLLSKYLSLNNYVDFLIFGEKYLPDEFVFKVGLTYEKHYKK